MNAIAVFNVLVFSGIFFKKFVVINAIIRVWVLLCW